MNQNDSCIRCVGPTRAACPRYRDAIPGLGTRSDLTSIDSSNPLTGGRRCILRACCERNPANLFRLAGALAAAHGGAPSRRKPSELPSGKRHGERVSWRILLAMSDA